MVGKVMSTHLAIAAVRVWCRSLHAQIGAARARRMRLMALDPNSVEEVGMLQFLLLTQNGAPFMDRTMDMDVYVDTSVPGWGCIVQNVSVFGRSEAGAIGTSSNRRELAGLLAALCVAEVQRACR